MTPTANPATTRGPRERVTNPRVRAHGRNAGDGGPGDDAKAPAAEAGVVADP